MTEKQLPKTLQNHHAWLGNSSRGVRADLRGADLRNMSFAAADLRFIDFRGADLTGCDLTDADCSNADFRGANLTRATCQRTKFTNAKMQGAIVGEMVRIVRPCLREEEIVTFREECFEAIGSIMGRLRERLQREAKRLGRGES